ncbi:MAG TPA: hypothetical protein VHX66_05320 [Solirubrobacteraceae bacterium]|jgi:hypothetical protein|nr:hypothetical protein [Solirubrobacteraceae bacterium]
MTPTAVYNVFHHSGILQVACHLQSDASSCWSPRTVTDAAGDNFATSGQPGLYMNQSTARLYVYATRASDGTGGVVCIDTTVAATSSDPFCGFTALTPVGEAPLGETSAAGISAISDPVLVGADWYAFNYVNGAGVSGAENELLCFDVATASACPSQPFALPTGGGSITANDYPPPAVSAVGSEVIVPITVGGGNELTCWGATATLGSCGGTWPIAAPGYDSSAGAAFPLLDATGEISGFCLPMGTDPCFTLAGGPVPTPPTLPDAVPASSGWNGPALVLGPRVYVPNGSTDQVYCFDYSTQAECANFPKAFNNLGLLYTVNADPQRPTCIWVNSDNGPGQIQNFDAYTAGACGQGPIRVLASSFVVPSAACTPLSYTSLQVTAPAPSTYTSGTVAVEDGDGTPVPTVPSQTLDNTGTASLAGLALNSPVGLPQFLITLAGEQGTPGSVVVRLTWTGANDPSCVGPGASVTAPIASATAATWAGYVDTKPPTSAAVSTRVTLPRFTCDAVGSASFWVGYDGWRNNTVEQDGVSAVCAGVNRAPTYQLWYELYKGNCIGSSSSCYGLSVGGVTIGPLFDIHEIPVSVPVKLTAGDAVDLFVDRVAGADLRGGGGADFGISVYNASGKRLAPAWTKPVPDPPLFNATYSSTECIAEWPLGPPAMPTFGKTLFTNCSVIDDATSDADLLKVDMTPNLGVAGIVKLASTSDIARNANGENSFTVSDPPVPGE